VDASSVFTGASLTFRVEGEGVSINPETGELSIATDRLQDGIAVRVTAANSGGTAQSVFRLTVRAMPVDGAPALVAAPALVGEARIGAAIELDAGRWSGTPEPVLAYQWQLDGADIAEAVGTSYTPLPADDGKALACRVTATNAAGAAEALTEPVAVTYAAPVASGTLEDLVLARGAEAAIVEAAPVFVGANLSFAVEGTGATIDAATGRVTISTDVALADAPVTVLAVNSGGAAESSFRVTVGAAAPALVAAPALSGEGRIGAPLEVAPGEWSGAPKPAIALQWLSDGAAVEGAVAASYVPGPADDGRAVACRVTASNEAGAAEAVTEPVVVTYAAPVVTGALADVSYTEGSGDQTVDAAAVFDGDALAFAVEGADATIDPATGTVTIPTDARLSAAPVTVTASNSGGAAAVDFRATVAADVPVVVAPALIAAPALVGTAEIGREVTVEPGAWSGGPALAFQWLRDGAVIEGATAAAYVPVPADDAAALACRVTATNSAGSAEAVTEPLGVSYAAPTAKGALPELVLDEDSGDEIVEAAGDFTGENLGFAVSGAGATVDPVTGRVTIPTAEPLEDLVTVSASNSGGTAESSFQVTVEAIAPEEGVPALRPEEWEIITINHPTENTPVVAFRMLGEAPVRPGYLFAALLEDTTGTAPGDGGWHQCVMHPEYDTAGHEGEGVWVRHAANGSYKSWLDITPRIGTEESFTLRYALDDPATVSVADAEFSLDSDVKTIELTLPGRDTGKDPDPGVEPDPETPEVAYVQSNSQAEHDENWPGGQGHQQTPSSAQCRDYPNVIAIGIDMGSIVISTDSGRTWGIPRRTGIYSSCCQGLAVDPVNPLHWLQQAIADDLTDNASAQWGGLYWSGDGLDSGKRVYSFANTVTDGNHIQGEALCFHPASSNGSRCMRAYAYLVGSSENHFVASTTGGESFSLIKAFPAATHGTPRVMTADPSNVNRLYVGAGNSLFRVTNANSASNISFTRLSGSGGLPAGAVHGKPYVSANGQTVIVGVRNRGVYKSTNGGGSWSQVYADNQLHKLHVNPFDPDRMFITYHSTSSDWSIKPKYSTNGSGFSETSSLEKRPGYTGMLNSGFEHNHAFYFGTGGEMFFCGRHTFRQSSDSNWRSTDSGKTFTLAMRGFSLESAGSWMAPQMFHPSNPLVFGLPYTDLGISYTNNGGKWFTLRRTHKELPNMDHGTAAAFAMHPNGSRVLAMIGRSSKGILVRCEMPNGTAYTPIDTSLRKYHGLCYDTDNPDYWYAANYRSTNGGIGFSPMTALGSDDLVWGCTIRDTSLSGGQAVFSINEGGNGRTVKRSTDRGGSFSTVLQADYHLINGIGTKQSPFRPHPTNHDILFTQTPNGRGIRRWNLASGSASNRPFTDLDPAVPSDVPFRILGLAIDPRYPDTMVIMNQYSNSGYALMRTTDGGITWDNLSHLVSQAKPNLLEISGANGDILFGTSNGARLIRAHYKDPKSNVGNVLWPNNVLPLNYMDEVIAGRAMR
jgi:hypothetical protein